MAPSAQLLFSDESEEDGEGEDDDGSSSDSDSSYDAGSGREEEEPEEQPPERRGALTATCLSQHGSSFLSCHTYNIHPISAACREPHAEPAPAAAPAAGASRGGDSSGGRAGMTRHDRFRFVFLGWVCVCVGCKKAKKGSKQVM